MKFKNKISHVEGEMVHFLDAGAEPATSTNKKAVRSSNCFFCVINLIFVNVIVVEIGFDFVFFEFSKMPNVLK